MLATATEHAVKPKQLAPPGNRDHNHIADLEWILADIKVNIIKDELLVSSGEAAPDRAKWVADIKTGGCSREITEAGATESAGGALTIRQVINIRGQLRRSRHW